MTPSEPNVTRVLELLRGAPLRHIVTLKMVHLVGPAMKCRLHEDQSGWALTSLIPTHAFEYDRRTYPDRDLVVLVDGTRQRQLFYGMTTVISRHAEGGV